MSWACHVVVEMLLILINLLLTCLIEAKSYIWPSEGKSQVFEWSQSVAEPSVTVLLRHVGARRHPNINNVSNVPQGQ